jgi:porin
MAITFCTRALAFALLAGISGEALSQSAPTTPGSKPVPPADQTGPPTPTGAAPETQRVPAAAAPTTNDPALNGRGEAPEGRDATAAFSPGNAAAGPAGQSSTPDWLARWERDNPLGNTLRRLKSAGIAVTGNYVGNIAGNPVGGVRHGFEESHWVDFGAELDLGKLLGLSGTRLHVQAASFDGSSLANNDIGSSISVQQTWRPVPGWRLTQLNVDHDFGRLNVMFGRAALNSYFGASPLNCVFMSNAACLTAYGPITAIGITAFPNSSWAGKLRWPSTRRSTRRSACSTTTTT